MVLLLCIYLLPSSTPTRVPWRWCGFIPFCFLNASHNPCRIVFDKPLWKEEKKKENMLKQIIQTQRWFSKQTYREWFLLPNCVLWVFIIIKPISPNAGRRIWRIIFLFPPLTSLSQYEGPKEWGGIHRWHIIRLTGDCRHPHIGKNMSRLTTQNYGSCPLLKQSRDHWLWVDKE